MELSLHGSQISLATRDKIQTPSIYYPPVHTNRPASASLSYHHRTSANRLTSRTSSSSSSNFCHQTRRPLSADSRFVGTKGSSSVKFNLGNNSSSNIFKLLIDEQQPMNSKYWSSSGGHQKSTLINPMQGKDEVESSIEDDSSMKRIRSDSKPAKKRPDSLNLSCNYNEITSDLAKMTSTSADHRHHPNSTANNGNPNVIQTSCASVSTVDVNQSKSLSVAGNKSHQDGKKSTTSYDLWVNENVGTKEKSENVGGGNNSASNVAREKKLDLPGRVSFSFSSNDVYEIDYSDYDDQETESSQASAAGNLEKLNKSLKDNNNIVRHNKISTGRIAGDDVEMNGKSYIKEHYMSNSDNEMDEIDYRYHPKSNNKSSKINQIIEDYKIETATINHRPPSAPPLMATSNQLNNTKLKSPTLASGSSSKLNQSTNPVIKNYLKAKEQDFLSSVDNFQQHNNHNNRVTITTSNKKLNDLSKKSKNLREMTKPKIPNMQTVAPFSAVKTSTAKPATLQTSSFNNSSCIASMVPASSTNDKVKKPKSPSTSSIYTRQDSKLNEFQIEKVVSWMSVNEENFSEFEFSIAGAPTSVDENKSINAVTGEHDSTYQEIVDIIKEIEHEKKDSEDFKLLKTDVEFKLNTILSSIESPSPDGENPSNDDDENGASNKAKEIFSYLDKVDSSSDKALISSKGSSFMDRRDTNLELEFALEPDVIEDVPKISDLLMLPNHQLARRIVKLSLRANELSNAIQLSKEHVANVRNDKSKTLRLEKLHGQNRLKEQKKNYEEIVARHQTFIEQLIKDKATLCEKNAQSTRRLDSQNQAWEHRLKTELERVKEQALAGEKIRREKWVRENTKKIKELTVKGLELEINKMTTNHKQEIEALKRQHQLDILKAIDETKDKYEKAERSIRDNYAEEREQAIERERRAIMERFEKQMNDERKSSEQHRLRLIHEFESEKDRIYAEMREKEHQYELKKEELMNEKMEILEDSKETFKEKLKQREAKFQTEFAKLQEQYECDFKIWKREFETKVKLRESERENAIREQYRLERDRQIDSIVAKVDAESIKNQQDFDAKLNRIKEKYENEIRDLESAEKGMKEKYIESRTRLASLEGENQNLKAISTQLELQLSHSSKLCEKFTAEKDQLRDEARSEIKNEMETMKREHETEIQRIYTRVQLAIQKKDATLDSMQKENGSLRERNLKLDAIIRQQRKDYCTK